MRRALLLLALVLCACGDGFVLQKTQVTFEPGTADFWSLPFPSDLRLEADGTYNIQRYPGMRSDLINMWIKAADARLTDGWGVSSGIFFTTNGEVDAATLPPSAKDSVGASASVYLVDVDTASPEYGRLLPLNVSFTAAETPLAPGNILEAIPAYGFIRRPHTTYAVVVTDAVKDTAGKPLGRSLSFHKALEQQAGADPKAAASFEPLRAWLKKEKRDQARVVAATVFHTMDPSTPLLKVAQWIEKQPDPAVVGPWKVEDDFQTFQWVSNRYTVPQIQPGTQPGSDRIRFDANGEPVQVGTQTVRLSLSIPKKPMPPGGFPLMIYFHGSGGEYREVIDRGPLPQTGDRSTLGEPPPGTGPAEYLARRGIAAMGFDFPLHGDRASPPDTTGLQLYNLFGNIEVTIDNMQVGAMEVMYLTRLIPKIQVPASLSTNFNAGGASDGMIRFDPNRLTGMGHSMGSTFGIPIASVDPRFKGFVFSGAGGSLVEIAYSATEPVVLKPFIELLMGFPDGTSLRRSHPMLHLFQNLWDYCDPAAKARYVAREPREGMKARPFMMTAGVRDGYFHPNAETDVAVPLGATEVGMEVDPITPDSLRLDGRDTAAYPLAGNLNGVTAGVVQYAAPFSLGHFVAFDETVTQRQYTCFVAGVGTAAGPKIDVPGDSDTTCP